TFTFNEGQYSSVTLAPGDGTTNVTVDDSADTTAANVVLSSSSLTGLPMGPINFGTGGINTLIFIGGSGDNSYTITSTPASQGTILNTGSGVDSITVQGTSFPLTILGDGSNDTLVGSDAGNLFTISGSDTGTLSGSAYASEV